jgi:WhiB family redox-sensing transcriptional regulator
MVTLRGDILTNWVKDAACRSVVVGPDQDDFFGIAENAPMSRAEVANSKSICRDFCPVQRECLKAALSAVEEWGVWGGYTAPERQRALRTYHNVKGVMLAFDSGILEAMVVRRV